MVLVDDRFVDDIDFLEQCVHLRLVLLAVSTTWFSCSPAAYLSTCSPVRIFVTHLRSTVYHSPSQCTSVPLGRRFVMYPCVTSVLLHCESKSYTAFARYDPFSLWCLLLSLASHWMFNLGHQLFVVKVDRPFNGKLAAPSNYLATQQPQPLPHNQQNCGTKIRTTAQQNR